MITYLVEDAIKPKDFIPYDDQISSNINPLDIVLRKGSSDYDKMIV